MKEFTSNAYCKKILGTLKIENQQLMWSEMGSTLPAINIKIFDIINILTADDTQNSNYKIKIETHQKNIIFSFSNIPNPKEIRDKVKLIIEDEFKKTILKEGSNSIQLDSNEIKRVRLMANNYHLREVYRELVKSGAMTEEEFWQQSQQILEEQKKDVASKEEGLPNSQLSLSGYQNQANKLEITFTKEDAKRLLKQYDELNYFYQLQVPLKQSEKDFWTEFLQEQYRHKTEIVGGDEPIYLEKRALDLYNSIHQKREAQSKSKQKLSVANDELEEIILQDNNYVPFSNGYGIYKKTNEYFGEEQMDKEQYEDIEAKKKTKKISNKVNKTSTFPSQIKLNKDENIQNLQKIEEEEEKSILVSNKKPNDPSLQKKIIPSHSEDCYKQFKKAISQLDPNFDLKNAFISNESSMEGLKNITTHVQNTHVILSDIAQSNEQIARAKLLFNKTTELLKHLYSQFPICSQINLEKVKKIRNILVNLRAEISNLKDENISQKSIFINLEKNIQKSLLIIDESMKLSENQR